MPSLHHVTLPSLCAFSMQCAHICTIIPVLNPMQCSMVQIIIYGIEVVHVAFTLTLQFVVLPAAGQHGKGKVPGEAREIVQYQRPLGLEWLFRKCRVVRLARHGVYWHLQLPHCSTKPLHERWDAMLTTAWVHIVSKKYVVRSKCSSCGNTSLSRTV